VCLLELIKKNHPPEGLQVFPFIGQGKGLMYMKMDKKKKKKKEKNKKVEKKS
jgi:hypothetical protein